MNELVSTQAHPDHCHALAPNLCDNDKKWVDCAYEESGPSVHSYALEESIGVSDQAFVLSDTSNRILGIWGHGSLDRPSGLGSIWLMSTEELWQKHARELTRRFRREILPKVDSVYPVYGCTVLNDNSRLIRWLAGANFTANHRSWRTGTLFTFMTREQ